MADAITEPVMMKNKGILPLCIVLAGVAWWMLMEWLRHRSWKRHKDSGFAPGTQHLAMLAAAGVLLCSIIAVLVFIFA